jgi:site-specific DNA-adenine methylase
VTIYNGLTAVFLDPPYDFSQRSNHIYTTDTDCSTQVREWALANGDNPLYRIALCGYEGEHDMPDSWECFEWKADGGYANRSNSRGKENRHRERVWFSPHCAKPVKRWGGIFGEEVVSLA